MNFLDTPIIKGIYLPPESWRDINSLVFGALLILGLLALFFTVVIIKQKSEAQP